MPKVSRPVIYIALGAVAVYAVVLNTQPDKPTAKRVVRTTRTTQKASADGVLPEDLKAHFPRYAGGARDPFTPGVVLTRPKLVKAASPPSIGGRTGWALTGINAVNGVASALIENSATGDSVFLQPGDKWNGLRVLAIKPDRVLFLNGLGRQDTLTFAAPPEDKTSGPTAGGTVAGGVTVPTAPKLPGAALSLQPYPVSPLRVQPRPGGSSALPALPPLSGAAFPQGENLPPPPGPDDNE